MTSQTREMSYFVVQAITVGDMIYSNDGDTAVVVGWAGGCGFVCVINCMTGSVFSQVPGLEYPANCVIMIPLVQGGCYFAVGFMDGSIQVFLQDETSKELIATDPLPKRHIRDVTSMALNNTGRVIASVSVDKTVCLWDVDMGVGK